MSMGNSATIRIVPGKIAPRYSEGQELTLEDIAITEQGTEEGLPIVDFRMRGPDGKFYMLALTGRIVNCIAAAVRGVNERIHGLPEP